MIDFARAFWRQDTAKKSKGKFEREVETAKEFLPQKNDKIPTTITSDSTSPTSDLTKAVQASDDSTGNSSNTASNDSASSVDDTNIPVPTDPASTAACAQASKTGNLGAVVQCAATADPEFPVELLAKVEFHKQISKATHGRSLGEIMKKQESSSEMSIEELIALFTGAKKNVAMGLAAIGRQAASIPEPASFMNKSVYKNNPYRLYAQRENPAKEVVTDSKVQAPLTSVVRQNTDRDTSEDNIVEGYLLSPGSDLFGSVSKRYGKCENGLHENLGINEE